MASSVLHVSKSDSPLLTLELLLLMLTTSADKRLPASSNEVRVRVDASKNMLITVLPRKRGHLAYGPPRHFDEQLRRVQDLIDVSLVQVGDAEQMVMPKTCAHAASYTPSARLPRRAAMLHRFDHPRR